MTDEMTRDAGATHGTGTRDEVRRRYAEAARAVGSSGHAALSTLDPVDSCAPSPDGGSDSCCGATAVDLAFGAGLYGANEQGELPAAASWRPVGESASPTSSPKTT